MDVTETGRQPAVDEPRTLGDYLALIWTYKLPILGIAVVAGGMALAVSLVGPRVYESIVTFTATQSKLGDAGQVLPNTAAFRPMVESLSTAAAVISELGLDRSSTPLRPSAFLAKVISVNEVRGTSVITVTAQYPDPVTAAAIANKVAEHAVLTARRVSASEASHALDLIKEQLDLAVKRLDVAETNQREYRQQTRAEALRRDVETRLGGPPTFSAPGTSQTSVFVGTQASGTAGLLDLTVKIASERARLLATERELAGRSHVGAAAGVVDTVYQELDAAAAATRSNLASLEKQKAELTSAHTLDAGTVALLDHLYAIETELARLDVEREVAEKNYKDLSQKYQEARLQVIGKSAEFVVIDPAVPADRPVPRNVVRNVAVVILIWLILAVAGVLMWESVKPRRSTR
jgi:uncharacterized protein involved in exopolysaccharide biosynthesis